MKETNHFDPAPCVKKKRLNLLPANPEKAAEGSAVSLGRFPSWLHRSMPKGMGLWQTGEVVSGKRLHTVCEESKCPNLIECWSKKTATFLVLGKECTRHCGFCDIAHSKTPQPVDDEEPQRVAESAKLLGLKHVVITMVARDDLPDGGANHLAKTVQAIFKANPGLTVEVLTSDFCGDLQSWDKVLEVQPHVFNHNIEAVRRLSPRVRHQATYDRTLSLLSHVSAHKKRATMKVKSGLMVGFGESEMEVRETLDDLKRAGCDIVTVGQYLQPSQKKLLVKEFVTPEKFKKYEEYGLKIGLQSVFSGPFVRSSYNAIDFIPK